MSAASNTYGPPQSSPPQQQKADYVGMLLEEAEKLYEGITKQIANEAIDEYISKTSAAVGIIITYVVIRAATVMTS